MHKFFCLLLIGLTTTASAQYYYNDILSNKQAQENYILLKKNNIKKITATTFDPGGVPTEGFGILQEINLSKSEIITLTKSAISPTSILLTTYLNNGYPSSTKDSTEAAVSITTYIYMNENKYDLSTIYTSTHEPEKSVVTFSEKRQYDFDSTQPKMMWRIKNEKDSLQVLFITDDHGRIGEERWLQKNKVTETYYYYYDTNNRLSDIVRYNKKANRFLPDYTFEYDQSGRLSVMIAFVNGTNQYRIWHYSYDGRGLKIKELIYNKYKQLEGKVLYNYE